MRIDPETGGASIVLVGNFNPSIFSPAWFAYNGILTPTQADGAEVEVVHPQLSSFRMDWLQVRVEQERFNVETTEAPFVRLLDFVLRTFTEFLVHTPITRLGINRMVHFSVGDGRTRNRIGRLLAPLRPWGEWGKTIDVKTEKALSKGLEKAFEPDTFDGGGMVSMSMQQSRPDDRPRGFLQVTVQPSVKIRHNAGIFMLVNDHYELGEPEKVVGCEQIMHILSKRFEASIKEAEKIVDQIMSLKDAV